MYTGPIYPPRESLRTHEPLELESPVDAETIRVRVYNAIMRSPVSSSPSHTSTELSTTLQGSPEVSEASRPSRRSVSERGTPAKGAGRGVQAHAQASSGDRPKFVIVGPLPHQVMELSDSSSGHSHASASTVDSARSYSAHAMMKRSASTSQLVEVRPLREGSPRACDSLRSIKSFTGYPIRTTDDEEVDWVDYEAEDPELDPFVAEETSSSSDDIDAPLMFNTSNNGRRRKAIDPAIIMLEDWLIDEPPPQTPQYRISKRPALSTIMSAPNSPTDGIRAVADMRNQSGPVQQDTKAGSSDYDADTEASERSCQGCGRKKSIGRWMRLDPCNHVVCSTCFGASISAVSTSRTMTMCPSCLKPMMSCSPADKGDKSTAIPAIKPTPRPNFPRIDQTLFVPEEGPGRHLVLRIDNVAWDITPDIVRAYLPPGVLPKDHPQPIHIPIDRCDGRTKDFMYIEVVDEEAARLVLKLRQNSHMPGGSLTNGRKRPVTITSVPLEELINELRPRSAAELHSLLALCEAAVACPQLAHPSYATMTSVVAPTGLAHFVKSRHGPFQNVMSIMTKLSGRNSPAYWDVFYLASGAIKALAQAITANACAYQLTHRDIAVKTQDEEVLEQMSKLFHSTFRNFN